MTFTTVIVFFPSVPGPSASEMNYAAVVLGGVFSLSLLYYFFPVHGGKYWFQGPVGALRAMEDEKEAKEAELQAEETKRRLAELDSLGEKSSVEAAKNREIETEPPA